MRTLLIQVQPDRAPELDPARVTDLMTRFAGCPAVASHSFTEGTDLARWMNFQFTTRNLPALWAAVQTAVLSDPEAGAALARSAMVLCHGDDGWNDYLLLHHFDPAEPLDTLA